MKKVLLLTLCILAFGIVTKGQDRKAVVTAAQVNGVYRYRTSEFRILALGHNKLKVQFNGEYMTRAGYPNIGEAMGEATIDGNIATFIPGDTQGCEITLVFLPNKLKVIQAGTDADCGFGHNVMADGTYRKIKGGKPKFIAMP
jgi:hypothetical protein